MDCALDRNLLEAYLDGEVGVDRALEVEAHLTRCDSCAAHARNWERIHSALQGAGLRYQAPASLEKKIRAILPNRAPKRNLSWAQRWLWAAGGAVVAAAALLLAFVASRPGIPAADQQIVASHVRSLLADHLMDVVSTDRHTVKPWFDGKIDFAPPVKDLAQAGYPLAGGRLDYLQNRKVAVLVYRHGLHVINLYIWPAGNRRNSSIQVHTLRGYNVLAWKAGGFQLRAVSDMDVAGLRDFARLVSP